MCVCVCVRVEKFQEYSVQNLGVIYTNCIYLVMWQTKGLILEHFLWCLLKYLLMNFERST